MTLDLLLRLASFSMSLGGFAALFVVKGRKQKVALLVAASVVALTTGAAILLDYKRRRTVARIQRQIVAVLDKRTLPFDQAYEELHHVPFILASEALDNAVERGLVGYRTIEFRTSDGDVLRTKGYYALPPH